VVVRFRIILALATVCIAHSLAAETKSETKPAPKSAAPCGPLADQTLHCPRFAFTYKVPFGWVDRTADMQEDSQAESQQSEAESSEQPKANQPSSENAETLLAVFERPPGAPGETINSAVVITAEPQVNYRGVKTAADYFGAISELAEQRGFKATSDPYLFAVGPRQLVRGDFSKERGKLTMYQTSLAMLEKGSIVTFTFVGGSDDEINELIEGLSFARTGTKPGPQK
jgi:hypothetical protein